MRTILVVFQSIFGVVVSGANPHLPRQDRKKLMHLGKELNSCPQEALAVTLRPFSVFEYIDLYQTCFELTSVNRIYPNGNQFRMLKLAGKPNNTGSSCWL